MLKSLIIWLSVTPSFATNLVSPNIQIINSKNEINKDPNESKIVSKNIFVDDLGKVGNQFETSPSATSQDLHIRGRHTDTHFRIFIDSGGDKSMPSSPVGKTNDYLIGKGKKDTWYTHLIPGASIDVIKYAENKDEFLKKYRAITFSYAYNYNFWNSQDGWSHNAGKNTPLMMALKTYDITFSNTSRLIFYKREASHANNESAKLEVKQEWIGNTLKYDFYLSVSYHWQAGSVIKHASFASFTADIYSFIFVPQSDSEKAVKIYHLDNESWFKFDYHTSISLDKLDEKIALKSKQAEISDSTFKTVTLFAYGYYGSQKVGGTNYIYSMVARSFGLGATDSSLILNGINRTRTLAQIYQYEKVNFRYVNSAGKEESTEPSPLRSLYLGMNLQGLIYAPFIYTV